MNQFRQWISMGVVLSDSIERFHLQMTALVDVCGISVARNKIMEEAIIHNCNWLLMQDADTWVDDAFPILRMISEAARYPNCAVAIGPTTKRDPDNNHLTIYRGDGSNAIPISQTELGDGLTEVSSGGAALMAINVDFVKNNLKAPWFEFTWKPAIDDSTKAYFTSEDRGFCDKVRAAGGIVVADGRFKTWHLQRPEPI